MNKWDLIKSFCTAKETIKEMKTHRIEENICKQSNQKGINLKIYKQSIYLSIQKKKKIKKWTENPDRHFAKEHIQLVKRHMKRCSTSLITREMQIKTTVRYITLY